MADTFSDDLNFFFFFIQLIVISLILFFLILGKICFVVSSVTLPRKQAEKNYIRQLQYLR